MPADRSSYASRRARTAERCRDRGFAGLVVGPGSDLTYLTGYRIPPSERLTALVLGPDGDAALVVPALEAARAEASAPDLALRMWQETDDPCALVATAIRDRGPIGLSDQLWAAFVLRLQAAFPDRAFRPASDITRELRIRKDRAELDALRAVSAAADRAYRRVLERPFARRSERDIAAALAELLRAEGHDEVLFTIVAAGPDGASPHHQTGDRRLSEGDAVVLDFGGTRDHYTSDITRTVHVGAAVGDDLRRVHGVVRRAQDAAYVAARAGATCASVDAAARAVIGEAGFGERFIHRTGHGIGLDGHEHPYLVAGNDERLEPGMAFSIEPGIYLPGRFGVRIEDIAVIAEDGRAEPLNHADRDLAIVA